MMESLDLHLIDLVQNAYSADSTSVGIEVHCHAEADRLIMQVTDNGRGMSDAVLDAVERGFFSSKCDACVGLGIPLLRQTAEHCGGRFTIQSRPGVGTRVTAEFQRSHVDLPPLGDLTATFLNLFVTAEGRRVSISYRCDEHCLEIDTTTVADLIGELPLQHPDVIRFLKGYIEERV